jgi:hypothetical protein
MGLAMPEWWTVASGSIASSSRSASKRGQTSM